MAGEAFVDNPAMTVPASYMQANLNGVNRSPANSAQNHEGDPEHIITRNDVGWRHIVRHFSPSWFSVTMGTGIVGVLLASIPYRANWLFWLSVCFYCLNVLLFVAAFVTSTIRYTVWPEIWGVMIRDPVNSLFLATIPMGFATLIEMWTLLCIPHWGEWAVQVAWILWMVDAVVAAAVTSILNFQLMSNSTIAHLSRITAAQLLPIAATVVAAGTGSVIAGELTVPEHALGTIMTCYVMWGMSVPLALVIIVIYYQRLAVHKLPPREVIVSCFLPLGPLGFGGNCLMHLGRVARDVLPKTGSLDPLAGEVAYIMGFFVAIILWGFGIMWLFFALATIYKSRPFPFNMGWWGFTFPLGVFSSCTIQIGEELGSAFFRVLGTIFACAVIALWVVVAIGTTRGAWTGKLFFAPCLAALEKHDDGHKVEVVAEAPDASVVGATSKEHHDA